MHDFFRMFPTLNELMDDFGGFIFCIFFCWLLVRFLAETAKSIWTFVHYVFGRKTK